MSAQYHNVIVGASEPSDITLEGLFSSEIKLKPGKIILSARQTQERIYFLKEGVIRRYSDHQEQEITNWFFAKGDLAICEESFLFGKKSNEYLETTCPTIVLEIDKMEYNKYLEKSIYWQEFFNSIVSTYSKRRLEHYNRTTAQSGLDNYKWFMQEFPYTYERVKLHDLASFLRLTEQSLSRIRSRIKDYDRANIKKINI